MGEVHQLTLAPDARVAPDQPGPAGRCEVDEPVGCGQGDQPEDGAEEDQGAGPPQDPPLQQDLFPVSHLTAHYQATATLSISLPGQTCSGLPAGFTPLTRRALHCTAFFSRLEIQFGWVATSQHTTIHLKYHTCTCTILYYCIM